MKFDPRPVDETVNVSPSRPLWDLWVLGTGVGSALLAAILLVSLLAGVLIRWVPPRFEAALFGGWTGDMAETLRAADDETAERLQGLLDRLAGHWPENPYDLRVGILPGASDPNAMALPGGGILVTQGLLDGLVSENAVAMVLGHEIGHFQQRDHLQGIGRGLAVHLLVASVFGLSTGGEAPIPVNALAELALRGFGREQERGADRFGMALVEAEYGHVAGSLEFFHWIEDVGGAERFETWTGTHPIPEDRITDLMAWAGSQGFRRGGETAVWAEDLVSPEEDSGASVGDTEAEPLGISAGGGD